MYYENEVLWLISILGIKLASDNDGMFKLVI